MRELVSREPRVRANYFPCLLRELLERSNHARWKSRQIELARDILQGRKSPSRFLRLRDSRRRPVTGNGVTARNRRRRGARRLHGELLSHFGFIVLFRRDPQRCNRARVVKWNFLRGLRHKLRYDKRGVWQVPLGYRCAKQFARSSRRGVNSKYRSFVLILCSPFRPVDEIDSW